ncbi:uncharacterized protein LOC143016656 [Genypterus blacodes]|uniref:uncharacterized protein LOC143016656 n=1 Tax=Genypterus blacodes TaxID=154954 RepID=UPI003F777A8D
MEDLYDNPVVVNVHSDQRHKEERVVDIYVSAESLTIYDNPWMEGMSAQTIPAEAQRTASVASANTGKRNLVVFLGLLCLLFLSVIICLGVQRREDRAANANLTENINRLITERDYLQTKLYETICPNGTKRFNGSCYHITNWKGSWWMSKNYCEHEGAQLLVISSTEEEEFVFKNVLESKERAWIGLRIRNAEKWVDGTPLTLEQSQRVKQLGDNQQGACIAMEKSQEEARASWRSLRDWNREFGICERRFVDFVVGSVLQHTSDNI